MFLSASQSYVSSSRQACRLYLSALTCLLILTCAASFSADEPATAESPKLYSPFDETKPAMPEQILSDKRLDKKVTISVKSKNMKDLFSEIRRVTGVSIVVAKEISAERPVIYFHDKPLRDVMTEISDLYGYYWLAKGQKDAWTYELFEDMVHAKRREQVRNDQETAQVDALLDCIDICTEAVKSDAALERLRQTSPRLYNSATEPLNNAILKVIRQMDRGFLRTVVNDVGETWDYSKLSPEMQAGVLDFVNAVPEGGNSEIFDRLADEGLSSTRVQIKRWRASVFTPPHLILLVHVPAKADGTGGTRLFEEWPDYDDGEPDLLNMPQQPAGRVIGDLPGDVKITIKQKHKLFHSGAILFPDAMEAIAKQAKLNVIADYYYQETPMPACTDEPLSKLVAEVCLKMDCSCQVEENTLRFRCNKWYLEPLQDEPPRSLQEYLWRRILETGGLSLEDLIDIACLRGRQTFWGGFRFIPQASQARLFPTTARTVRALGWELEDQACTPGGLPVLRLGPKQLAALTEWARVMGVKEPEVVLGSVIRMVKSGNPTNRLSVTLALPDGKTRSIAMAAQVQVLSQEDRRTLAAERAAELVADKVE